MPLRNFCRRSLHNGRRYVRKTISVCTLHALKLPTSRLKLPHSKGRLRKLKWIKGVLN
ncbi:hypothetical protein HanIR_Chr17g0886391 [Helianthus annuus]|nr:hypothetical protein HanIR_Chr17g0886391 [Helianthus annuus]